MMRKLMNISFNELLVVLVILGLMALLCWPIYTRVTSYIPGCPDVRCRVDADGWIEISWYSDAEGHVVYSWHIAANNSAAEIREIMEKRQAIIDAKRWRQREARAQAKQRLREVRWGG